MKSDGSKGIGRREFLRLAGVAGLAVAGMACAPAAAPPAATPTKAAAAPSPVAKAPEVSPTPSDQDAMAKLYEAAKKEGEVMVYGCGTKQDFDDIAAAFTQKYPGIKAEGYIATSEQVRDKILSEAKARKVIGETFYRVPLGDAYVYLQEGVLEPFVSVQAKAFDSTHYDSKGSWYLQAWYPFLPEYNTKIIPKEQAPKSYADMLKPEFKGKLGLEANAVSWFTSMLSVMGKEKGLEYMRKLAEQKPRLISGHYNLQALVVSGEVPVAVYMNSSIVMLEKGKGSPIEWIDPVEGTGAEFVFTATLKNAPHPNAARLMSEFLLSEEGAKLVLKTLQLPTRKGVDLGNLAPVAKVKSPTQPDPQRGKEIIDNSPIFREIFGKP